MEDDMATNELMIELLTANWQYLLVAFYVLEKVVKLSPSKKDDILVDIVWSAIKKLLGK